MSSKIALRLRLWVSPVVCWVVSKATPSELPEVIVTQRWRRTSDSKISSLVTVAYRGISRCESHWSTNGNLTVESPVETTLSLPREVLR